MISKNSRGHLFSLTLCLITLFALASCSTTEANRQIAGEEKKTEKFQTDFYKHKLEKNIYF